MKNVIVHIAAIGAIVALSACGSSNGVVPQTASQPASNLNPASLAGYGRTPDDGYATVDSRLRASSLAGYGRTPNDGYATNP
jgi:hypothetical protein